jgi:hypothetical protein
MRFSMRCVLAVTTYVALVAAAMVTYREFLFELVWAIAIVGFCYAGVVATVGRGRRQALAVGFVVMFAIHASCVLFYPDRSPVNWLYLPAGYYVNSGMVYEVSANPRFQANLADSWFWNVRVLYPAATLLAGLIGLGTGALAWRTCERSKPATATLHGGERSD